MSSVRSFPNNDFVLVFSKTFFSSSCVRILLSSSHAFLSSFLSLAQCAKVLNCSVCKGTEGLNGEADAITTTETDIPLQQTL